MSTKEASERGIEIVGDFNDRYNFNEDKKYRSKMDVAKKIIDGGLREVKKVADMLGGESA